MVCLSSVNKPNFLIDKDNVSKTVSGHKQFVCLEEIHLIAKTAKEGIYKEGKEEIREHIK